jgi:hypothetical protein
VIDFCPDGYLPALKVVAAAAQRWFAERFTQLENATVSQQETDSESSIEKAVRIFSQTPIPDDWRQVLEEIKNETVHRLRNLLHEGKLHGYYFDKDGRHTISREFWATAEADGVVECGVYWPFGRPSRLYEQRTNYALFLLQSELDTLLSIEPAKKGPLPRSRISDLVAALRELGALPTRRAQYDALRELPQFHKFKITRADFREAARQVPRGRGRKSRQETRQETRR